jgi:phytoene dehydrogenase-like protein
MTTAEFLQAKGFSEKMIARFFQPFFAGVCLDPEIRASSHVFQYVFQMFANGDVALPARGMGAIADQLAAQLPRDCIKTGIRIAAADAGGVKSTTGQHFDARAVVLAAEAPETARICDLPWPGESLGEYCLYFAAANAPVAAPFLILNGDGKGRVNSLTVPSTVVPGYAPPDQHLVSVVVIENPVADDSHLEQDVRSELAEWFGPEVDAWRHLKTFPIQHALPTQLPPLPDPTQADPAAATGVYICGEFNSVPGIQWAMLSGRLAAEQVVRDLERGSKNDQTPA